jgi:hypothetical protein
MARVGPQRHEKLNDDIVQTRWLPQLQNEANKSTLKRDTFCFVKTQREVLIKPKSDLLKYFIFTSAERKLMKLKTVTKMCERTVTSSPRVNL